MATSKKGKISQVKKATADKPTQVVYIGPNMGGDLPMTQFTVYRGGLPLPVQARAESDPDFSRLLVPVEDLAAARAELKVKTSVRGMAYAAVMKSRRAK